MAFLFRHKGKDKDKDHHDSAQQQQQPPPHAHAPIITFTPSTLTMPTSSTMSRSNTQPVPKSPVQAPAPPPSTPVETLLAVEQNLDTSDMKRLGFLPKDVATALLSLPPNATATDARLDAVVRTLKRYCYETVAARVDVSLDDTVLLLDLLYPMMVLLPDIDNNDHASDWKYRPHISANSKQHKPVLTALFDDAINGQVALKFFTAFPPSMQIPTDSDASDIDNDTANVNATSKGSEEKRAAMQTFIASLNTLLSDLHAIELNTDVMEIKLHYAEFYHAYFRTQLRSHFIPTAMLISELLVAVKWLYSYTTQLEDMLDHNESALAMALELDDLLDSLMDVHEDASKARIIEWTTNILRNEQRSELVHDDDQFPLTNGPQDLFININSLYDHAVNQELGDKALFRIGVMYGQCLLYYQECLKRFLAQLEVAEAAGQSALIKPKQFLFAQINNSQHYDDDTEEWRQRVMETIATLPDDHLDDWDELMEDIQSGWFDVAAASVEVLMKHALRPLLPSLSQLFHSAHLNDPDFLTRTIINPLSEEYVQASRSIKRSTFIQNFVQQSCIAILNIYVRALLANGAKHSAQVASAIAHDKQMIVSFYRDWESYMPLEVLNDKLSLLTMLQKLASDPVVRAHDVAPVIQSIRMKLGKDPVVPPYFAIHTMLTEIRRDVDSRELKEILSVFSAEEQLEYAEQSKLTRISLTDLSLTGTTVTYALSITVDHANGLAIKDTTSSDPYVMVYLFESATSKQPLAVRRTKYIAKSLDPNWSATFDDFTSKDASAFQIIIFEVWDRDVLSSEFMGKAALTVEEIRKAKLLSIGGPTLSGSGLPALPSMTNKSTLIERDNADKSMPFTLKLQPREGSKAANDGVISGTLTVKIAYFSKPIPALKIASTPAPANNAVVPDSAATQKQKPVATATAAVTAGASLAAPPTAVRAVSASKSPATHPAIVDLSTSAIMNKLVLDGGDSSLAVPIQDEAARRTLLDRVMFRNKKKLVKPSKAVNKDKAKRKSSKEDAAATVAAVPVNDPVVTRATARERQLREQRQAALADEARLADEAAQRKAEIARLSGKEGASTVYRTFKPVRRWFGKKANSHAQMIAMRELQQRERQQRHEASKARERVALDVTQKKKKKASLLGLFY